MNSNKSLSGYGGMQFGPQSRSTTQAHHHQQQSNSIGSAFDRELETWMVSGSSSTAADQSIQMVQNLPARNADSSIIAQDDDFLEPYPMIHPNNQNAQQSRNDDLRMFLNFVTSGTKQAGNTPLSVSTMQQQQNAASLGYQPTSDLFAGQLGIKQTATIGFGTSCTPTTTSLDKPTTIATEESIPRFRDYQDQQWHEQFQGLLVYIQKYGHSCVPNKLDENPKLGRWVKRQRYQYKLLQQGKQSTLIPSRVRALEEVGFVWDSHAALWVERLNELKEFRIANGHCNVPSTYPENVQLSTWVKCQRRQYKLYITGEKTSNLTDERIAALEKLGFEWDGRLVRSISRTVGKF